MSRGTSKGKSRKTYSGPRRRTGRAKRKKKKAKIEIADETVRGRRKLFVEEGDTGAQGMTAAEVYGADAFVPDSVPGDLALSATAYSHGYDVSNGVPDGTGGFYVDDGHGGSAYMAPDGTYYSSEQLAGTQYALVPTEEWTAEAGTGVWGDDGTAQSEHSHAASYYHGAASGHAHSDAGDGTGSYYPYEPSQGYAYSEAPVASEWGAAGYYGPGYADDGGGTYALADDGSEYPTTAGAEAPAAYELVEAPPEFRDVPQPEVPQRRSRLPRRLRKRYSVKSMKRRAQAALHEKWKRPSKAKALLLKYIRPSKTSKAELERRARRNVRRHQRLDPGGDHAPPPHDDAGDYSSEDSVWTDDSVEVSKLRWTWNDRVDPSTELHDENFDPDVLAVVKHDVQTMERERLATWTTTAWRVLEGSARALGRLTLRVALLISVVAVVNYAVVNWLPEIPTVTEFGRAVWAEGTARWDAAIAWVDSAWHEAGDALTSWAGVFFTPETELLAAGVLIGLVVLCAFYRYIKAVLLWRAQRKRLVRVDVPLRPLEDYDPELAERAETDAATVASNTSTVGQDPRMLTWKLRKHVKGAVEETGITFVYKDMGDSGVDIQAALNRQRQTGAAALTEMMGPPASKPGDDSKPKLNARQQALVDAAVKAAQAKFNDVPVAAQRLGRKARQKALAEEKQRKAQAAELAKAKAKEDKAYGAAQAKEQAAAATPKTEAERLEETAINLARAGKDPSGGVGAAKKTDDVMISYMGVYGVRTKKARRPVSAGPLGRADRDKGPEDRFTGRRKGVLEELARQTAKREAAKTKGLRGMVRRVMSARPASASAVHVELGTITEGKDGDAAVPDEAAHLVRAASRRGLGDIVSQVHGAAAAANVRKRDDDGRYVAMPTLAAVAADADDVDSAAGAAAMDKPRDRGKDKKLYEKRILKRDIPPPKPPKDWRRIPFNFQDPEERAKRGLAPPRDPRSWLKGGKQLKQFVHFKGATGPRRAVRRKVSKLKGSEPPREDLDPFHEHKHPIVQKRAVEHNIALASWYEQHRLRHRKMDVHNAKLGAYHAHGRRLFGVHHVARRMDPAPPVFKQPTMAGRAVRPSSAPARGRAVPLAMRTPRDYSARPGGRQLVPRLDLHMLVEERDRRIGDFAGDGLSAKPAMATAAAGATAAAATATASAAGTASTVGAAATRVGVDYDDIDADELYYEDDEPSDSDESGESDADERTPMTAGDGGGATAGGSAVRGE